MRVRPQDAGTLHFIGIGGIGMSGIAEILHDLGYSVQGSDLSDSANVQRLRAKGIRVITGHDAANLKDEKGALAAAVVRSSAVKDGNPELAAAFAARLPVVRRAEMLAELMRLKKAVAVGGTHGKTTTTSMVGAMLEEGGLDPTVINGGIVNRYGTNIRLGKGEWIVAEADESDGSFTCLPAMVAIVTNIDPEHMEHYGDFDSVRRAYRHYIENVPFYGFAVLCLDHPEVQALIPDLSGRRLVTYGFSPQADIHGHNLRAEKGCSLFDVTFAALPGREEFTLRDVCLPMLGQHNAQNALAALAVARELDIAPPLMRRALENFSGVKRRFTRTGEANGITVIDDYGHHPVEIAAVLRAARMAVEETGGRVIAVAQPHRYTRLHSLFEEFCTCFYDADTLFVADVYAAGEQPIGGATKEDLAAGVTRHGHRDVRILAGPDELPARIAEVAQPGDYVICLGAGDITKWANALPDALSSIFGGQKKQRA